MGRLALGRVAMAALVGLEGALAREALAAAGTEVGPPLPEDARAARVRRGHACVGALVVEQEARLAEAAAALRALVWLLAAVDALVREQVLLEAEAAPALWAGEGSLAGVGALVHLEVVLDAEGLAALRTHEGSRAASPSVRLLMPHQAGLLREGLAAQRATVGLLFRRVVDDQASLVPQTLLPVPRRGPSPGGRQFGHGHFQLQSPAPGEPEAEKGVRGQGNPRISQPQPRGGGAVPLTSHNFQHLHPTVWFKPVFPCWNALLSLPPITS